MNTPTLQFGTSRFLLAHVDLFVSEALEAGRALGGITVVQTTANPASAARVAALAAGDSYPVRLRGLRRGERIDREVRCRAVVQAMRADIDWPRLLGEVLPGVQVIVSNTADRGYELDERDTLAALMPGRPAPHSFPAKLLVLLWQRWQRQPAAPLSVLPCELLERNGDTLRELVCGLAVRWQAPTAFLSWLREHPVWANSLVDRIVSEPIEPVGAVAEPYALWAVERQPGLVLPCEHPDIVLTDDLARHARLKLFLLNGAHTYLAERWLLDGGPADLTVSQALHTAPLREALEALWTEEIVPVFEALGQRDAAEQYLVELRERFANPFLAHRIADIAQHHVEKKRRRLAPIVELAAAQGLVLAQPRLRHALART